MNYFVTTTEINNFVTVGHVTEFFKNNKYVSLAESDFFFTRLRYIVFEKYFLEFKFQGIESLILKFKDNFVKSDGKIGITDLVTHTYRRDTTPVFVYRLMTHYIVQMLQNNVTEPSNSGRYWC